MWSRLEYGCHLRDVLLVQRERVLYILRVDGGEYPPMGREERADHDRYSEQQPHDVVRQLVDAAAMFARVVSGRTDDEWRRSIVYNYPRRTQRTLRWVAVHTLHECLHHLHDIRRQSN